MSARIAPIERPSPNFDRRPLGAPIDILLLHYTGMQSAEAALARLCDPAARVSAHYLIDEDGTCWRLVDEAMRAWHAGVGSWGDCRDINAQSIGIELVNPGHEFGYRPFAEAQMAALVALAPRILSRHPIPAARVLGHSDVAPARKQDPGELFDWASLACEGIGLWPEPHAEVPSGLSELRPGMSGPAVASLQADLGRYGYGLSATGSYDAATTLVVTAFQRHFLQHRVNGIADPDTRLRLRDLLTHL